MKLLRWFALPSLVLSFPTLVWAEVCDKEVPSWSPSDGPVNQWDSLVNFFTHPLGLFLIFTLVVAFFLRERWLWVLTTSLYSLIALQTFASWRDRDEIFNAAIEEGCRTHPFLILSVMLAVILFSTIRIFVPQRRLS